MSQVAEVWAFNWSSEKSAHPLTCLHLIGLLCYLLWGAPRSHLLLRYFHC